MTALARLGALRAVQAVAVVMCLGALAGSIRLLPWLWAPDVPLRLCLPFARELAVRAAEVSLLAGVPLGAALAAAAFVERGEARALFALGASPFRVASGLLVVLVLAGGTLVAIAALPRAAPGRLVAALLAEGRASCVRSTGKTVTVPLAAVTWVCPAGGRPRLVGRVPRMAGNWWFSASSALPNDDLSELRLTDLTVLPPFDRPRTELSVERAVLRGMPSWGRSSDLHPRPRAAIFGVGLVGSGAAAVLSILLGGHRSPWIAALIALAGSVTVLLLGQAVEKGAAPGWAVAIPPSAVALQAILSLSIRRFSLPARR